MKSPDWLSITVTNGRIASSEETLRYAFWVTRLPVPTALKTSLIW
jgi:hypothetical protein